MYEAKKILILGGPGSGKSILSYNLGKKLNIPVYHLDDIHIQHNNDKSGKEKRNKEIIKILKNNKWIMDGNYRSTLDKRIEKCNIVIFLDYPISKLICSIISRFIKHHFKIKKEIISGNNKLNLEIIKLAYKWKKEKRGEIINVLTNTNKKIYMFKSRKQLNYWYKKEFNEQIRSVNYE